MHHEIGATNNGEGRPWGNSIPNPEYKTKKIGFINAGTSIALMPAKKA